MTDLTIVIPTINRPTLSTAMVSVFEQTKPTELVVVSDMAHTSAGVTRNRGIQAVTTEWVGFCDDDDRLDSNYHKKMSKYFKDYDVVVARMKVLNKVLPDPWMDKPEHLMYKHVGISFCMRTELAKQYPFHNEFEQGRGEDWGMIERVRDAGAKIKLIPDVLYYVRRAYA